MFMDSLNTMDIYLQSLSGRPPFPQEAEFVWDSLMLLQTCLWLLLKYVHKNKFLNMKTNVNTLERHDSDKLLHINIIAAKF